MYMLSLSTYYNLLNHPTKCLYLNMSNQSFIQKIRKGLPDTDIISLLIFPGGSAKVDDSIEIRW